MKRRLPPDNRAFGVARLLLPVLLGLAASGAWAQSWSALNASQQAALGPLKAQWSQLDSERRAQWLALADRFPDLSPAERQRLQNRMIDWSQLSPDERGATRLQFHEAQRWSPQERQDRWREYQSLDPQARLILAHRWKLEGAARAQAEAQATSKRNLLEKQRPTSEPPRTASPTTVRARSGATSRPIASDAANPAPQQQVGLPKVAATPAFVDRETLLPRRGPQAAGVTRATRPAKDAKNDKD